ncbi:protein YgfX [Vibrio sinaloensis]|nr:protein YgfX [Vibrio sinaloensis]
MPQWWIKLSPITSVKSVRFYSGPSLLAKQVNILILVLACLIIILSTIPLTPSALLLAFVVNLFFRHGFLVEAMNGEIVLKSSQTLEYNQSVCKLRKVIFSVDSVALLLIVGNGQRLVLWRDSLDEASYRHLLVQLKKEP